MSTEYSASAFFGTFAPERSEIGTMLSRFIEHGTPGKTSDPEVVIDRVGAAPTGETFIIIRHKTEHSASRLQHDSPYEPVALRWPHSAAANIAAWLTEQGIDPFELAPIGWHFAASCG